MIKTSEEWSKSFIDYFQICDPDGWDRSNFHYSWMEQKITLDEFVRRFARSTCYFSKNYNEVLKHINKVKEENDN